MVFKQQVPTSNTALTWNIKNNGDHNDDITKAVEESVLVHTKYKI
jgi:hypothetical protein